MKLPEKIKGRNRIRDAAIVVCFKKQHMDYPAIAEKFKLTERRILQILSTNHAFIKRDKEWEKEKRINILGRLIEEKKNNSSKDVTDILEQQRREIEGDDKASHSGETKIIIIRPPLEAKQQEPEVATRNQAQVISRSISI